MNQVEPGSLFRRETLEEAMTRAGAPLRSRGLAGWVVTAFCLTVLAVVSLFVATEGYARDESVSGVVVPSDGSLTLTSPKAGIVTKIFTPEGQSVAQFAPILAISSDPKLDGGETKGSLLIRSADEQDLALARQSAAGGLLLKQQLDDIRIRRSSLESQVQDLAEEIRLQQEDLAINSEAERAAKSLFDQELMSLVD